MEWNSSQWKNIWRRWKNSEFINGGSRNCYQEVFILSFVKKKQINKSVIVILIIHLLLLINVILITKIVHTIHFLHSNREVNSLLLSSLSLNQFYSDFSPERPPPIPQHRSKIHSHHHGHLSYDVSFPFSVSLSSSLIFRILLLRSSIFILLSMVFLQLDIITIRLFEAWFASIININELVSRSQDSLGHIQLSLSYEHPSQRLIVRVLSARGLKVSRGRGEGEGKGEGKGLNRWYLPVQARDSSRGHAAPNPFVKIYLLPGRKWVQTFQNISD